MFEFYLKIELIMIKYLLNVSALFFNANLCICENISLHFFNLCVFFINFIVKFISFCYPGNNGLYWRPNNCHYRHTQLEIFKTLVILRSYFKYSYLPTKFFKLENFKLQTQIFKFFLTMCKL